MYLQIQSSPLLAGDWNGFCQKPAEEQFQLSVSLAQDSKDFHMELCSLDFNLISSELASVIDIAEIENVVGLSFGISLWLLLRPNPISVDFRFVPFHICKGYYFFMWYLQVTQVSNDSLDVQELLQNSMKMQAVLTRMGLEEKFFDMDLSWLDEKVWLGLLTRLTSSYENKTLLERQVKNFPNHTRLIFRKRFRKMVNFAYKR